MIREFSVKTKPTNNKARLVFVFGMSLAFLFLAISTLIKSYQGLVSIVGVAFLTVAITVYTKYVASVYYYDITFDSEGTPLFVVRQQTGKRYTTLCRISLREISGVEKQDAKQRRAHKTPAGINKYSYLPTLGPALVYRITTIGKYERAEILIESSEGFAELLSSYATEAKETWTNEQDEY